MPQELRTHVINLKSLDQDISDPIIAGGGDVNGRTLRVILTQEAWAQMTSSTKIYLKWRHKQLDIRGYNVLRQVSEEPCMWEINWPSAMLRKGDVLACLELVDKVSISPTVNFIVHVLEDPIGNSGFKNEDDWSEFQKAALKLQDLEEKIKRIESLEMGETLYDYVSDYTIGGIQKGDVIPKGRTFDQFVRHLVTDYQSLRYTMPTTSLYVADDNYDISSGSLGNIQVSLIFNQNDAGPIKSVRFVCKGNDSLQIDHTPISIEGQGPSQDVFPTTISLIVPEGVFEIYAQVSYEEGFVKVDKFGEPVPGEIGAGTIDTNTVKLSANKYDIYYYTTSGSIPSDLSKDFPDTNRLTKLDTKVVSGDSFKVPVLDSGNLTLYVPKEALSKPETRKIRSWEVSQDNPSGKITWRDIGEVTDPIPDSIVESLGWYHYQTQLPATYQYNPKVRVNL